MIEHPAQRRCIGARDAARDGVCLHRQKALARHPHEGQRDDHTDHDRHRPAAVVGAGEHHHEDGVRREDRGDGQRAGDDPCRAA